MVAPRFSVKELPRYTCSGRVALIVENSLFCRSPGACCLPTCNIFFYNATANQLDSQCPILVLCIPFGSRYDILPRYLGYSGPSTHKKLGRTWTCVTLPYASPGFHAQYEDRLSCSITVTSSQGAQLRRRGLLLAIQSCQAPTGNSGGGQPWRPGSHIRSNSAFGARSGAARIHSPMTACSNR